MYNEQAFDLVMQASNDESCFMQQDNIDRQHVLENSIRRFEQVCKEMARLNLLKEELTSEIIGALGHEHEGQKTYEYNVWKIEVKTPVSYSVNKKLYELCEINLPSDFNPVKKSVSYAVDKRLCDNYLLTAPEDVKQLLVEIIDKKPGKAAVTIKERTS